MDESVGERRAGHGEPHRELLAIRDDDERRRERPHGDEQDEELGAEDAIREQERSGRERRERDGVTAGAGARGENDERRDEHDLDERHPDVQPGADTRVVRRIRAGRRQAHHGQRQVPDRLPGDSAIALELVRAEDVPRIPREERERQRRERHGEAGRQRHEPSARRAVRGARRRAEGARARATT